MPRAAGGGARRPPQPPLRQRRGGAAEVDALRAASPPAVPPPAGVPCWAALLGAGTAAVAAAAAVYLSGAASLHNAGLTISVGICVLTLSGVHMLFTWAWLVLTAGLVLMGSEGGIGVMAAFGVNVWVSWYGTNTLARSEKSLERACLGMARWAIENVLGDILHFYMPHWDKGGAPHQCNSYISWRGSFPLGFLMCDLALHFVPVMALLQMTAEYLSLWHVAGAYLCARTLMVAVTAHHINFDYGLVGTHRRLRVWRQSERVTPFPTEGKVLAQVYGMEPPPSPRLFHVVFRLEALGTLLLAAVCCSPHKAAILRALGGAAVASPAALVCVSAAGSAAGVVVIVAGIAVARQRMPPHLRGATAAPYRAAAVPALRPASPASPNTGTVTLG